MIYGIGTDIIEISRIREAIEKYGTRFKDRIFTKEEQEYCDSFNDTKYLHYAARFAAKESFSKAIGTGITQGFKFNEISITNEENGKPVLALSGDLFDKWGSMKVHISLTHSDNNAVAFVMLEEIRN